MNANEKEKIKEKARENIAEKIREQYGNSTSPDIERRIQDEVNIEFAMFSVDLAVEIDDKVEGLDNGANDYLTKPFDTRELLARIRVLTRSEKQQDNVITLGNISLNTTTCELSSPSGSFLLTNKEYQMMLMFMNNKTQVISAEHFMEKIWDSESDSDISTVWTYISYLRRKLEALKSDYSIATRRNMGYYLKNNN